MRDLAKRVRRGLKEPVQTAFAWAVVRGLDTRPRSPEEVRALQPRAIVVSRTDRLGDLLVSSVMIGALHRRWPDARLVVIAGPRNRSALDGLPFAEAGPVFHRSPRSWVELGRWLGAQGFDLAMSLQAESMAGVMIAAASRAPVRMVTHPTKAAPAFNFIFGTNVLHHVTRFCRAADLLGVPWTDHRPAYVVPAAAREQVREVLAEWAASGQPVVGIQIPNRSSGRRAARAWPAERVEGLARVLAGRGRRVVLFGFGAEVAEAVRVRGAVPEVEVAPPLPLGPTAALLERVDVFVSGFTGTYHLADAVGVRTVLVGSAHYADYWRALGPGHRYALAGSAAEVPLEPVERAVEELLVLRGQRP